MTARQGRILSAVASVCGLSPRELVTHAQGWQRAVYGKRLAAYVLALDGARDGEIAALLGREADWAKRARRMVAGNIGRLPGLRADLARLARMLEGGR